MRQASHDHEAAAALAARLRSRREEITEATLLRVCAVSAMPRAAGPEYAEGLRAAVAAAVAYGLEGIERDGDAAAPVPAPLLEQARLAAASGVGLDTVLRRYLAGHALLGDFIVGEAESGEALGPAELRSLLGCLAAAVDRLLEAVSDAYAEEVERRHRDGERRRAELVERLLVGKPAAAAELDYDLDSHHLGLIASGPGAGKAAAALARSLDARPLVLPREGEVAWAWLGRRDGIDPKDVGLLVEASWRPGVSLAVGEPAEGPAGWRLTHRQARVAHPIAVRSPQVLVRYADVALLAATLQDDLLATSLRRLYLEPLEGERDGGETLRETLCAYLAAERNVSSAAAILGVSRKTVNNRLRIAEDRIGRSLGDGTAELEAALRLHQLDEPSPPRR
ncbi:MAG TPA: helix-turn-helix domain-containing protein [Solirubrobacterales bacterium]|nr:helix-turn-helix domain-containing protein [Solirubrobacterales bacterium]